MAQQVSIVVMEDEQVVIDQISGLIKDYAHNKGVEIEVSSFQSAEIFLMQYHSGYDAVFLDINMPQMSGMDVARKLRELDEHVIIVFITNLQQYAVEGYSVNALDFLLKPVTTVRMNLLLDKIMGRLEVEDDSEIVVAHKGILHRMHYRDILYIGISSHRITFHLTDGRIVEDWGSLKQLKSKLPADRFFPCNSCYIVNLQYARSIDENCVTVGEDKLPISRPRKQEFMRALLAYLDK